MKKLIAAILVYTLLFGSIVTPVAAIEIPSPPPVPSAPPIPTNTGTNNSVPTPPPAPSMPPTVPSAPPAPSAPPNPSSVPLPPSPAPSKVPTPSVNPSPSANPSAGNNSTNNSNGSTNNNSGANVTATPAPSATPTGQILGETTGGQQNSHGSGSGTIETGAANTSGILTNTANTNGASTNGSGSGSANDINVGNAGNGVDSNNSSQVNTANNSSTIQTNDANVNNNANLASVSGSNQSSYNNGPTKVVSGDANTTATVINGVNTNVDGVAVVEFNVDDTHKGDIILAAPSASGCTATVCGVNGTLTAKNVGNGAQSTNTAAATTKNSDTTFQNNTADVTNDLVLSADSGRNQTNYNTGGDNQIKTGNANVVATVGNFVNNSIAGAGTVLVNVVNIFGDLVGNILLPESSVAGNGTGSGTTTVVNTGNGAQSTNTAAATTTNNVTTKQTNNAAIANNINAAATTGENKAKDNTGAFNNGGSVIDSGTATVNVNAVNIANNNIVSGDSWWLVFVNDASGKWIGQIMGSPTGSTMAGSAGTQFIVNPDGTIIAQNTGNGASSNNNAAVVSSNTTATTQNNQAKIVNNLTLDANTGKNQSSYNTGGNSSISTGNANVMANILNFVNNNFAGGKVVVSLVNVFGSWLGSFAPPGAQAPQLAGTGGADVHNTPQNNTNNNSNNSGNNATSSSTSSSSDRTQASTNVNGQAQTQPTNNENSDLAQVLGLTGKIGMGDDAPKKSNTVENDDTITVPVPPKIAGAKSSKSIIPLWILRVLIVGTIVLLIKRWYDLKRSRQHLPA